jgi:hypothetical protein
MNKRGDCTQEWRSISVGFYLNGIFYTLGYVNPSDYGREVTFTLTENDLRDTGLDLNQNPRVQLVIRGVCRDNRNGEYQGYQVQFLSPSQASCCNYSLSANTTENNKVRVEIKQTGFGCSPLSSIDIKIKGKCANGNVVTGPSYTITDTSFREKTFTYDLGTYNCSVEGYDLEYIFYCQGQEQQRKVIPLKPPYSGNDNCCPEYLTDAVIEKAEYIMNKRAIRFYYKFPYSCAFSREIKYVIYNPDPATITHTVNSNEGYIDIPTAAIKPIYVRNNSDPADCSLRMEFQFLALCPDGKIHQSEMVVYDLGKNFCAENNGCETEATLSKIYPIRYKEIYNQFTSIVCGEMVDGPPTWHQTKFTWGLGFLIQCTNYLHTIDENELPDGYNWIKVFITVGNINFQGRGRMVGLNTIKGVISFRELDSLRFFACASTFSMRISYTCKRTNQVKNINVKIPDHLVPGFKGSYHGPWLLQDMNQASYLAYVTAPSIYRFYRTSQDLFRVILYHPYLTCKSSFGSGYNKLIRAYLYGSPRHLEEVTDSDGNSFLVKNTLNDPDNPSYITHYGIPNQVLRNGDFYDSYNFMEYLNYAHSHYKDPYSYPYERLRCLVLRNEEYSSGFKMIPGLGPEMGFIYYTTPMTPNESLPSRGCTAIRHYEQYQPGFGFIKLDYVYQTNGSNQAGKFDYHNLYFNDWDNHLYFNLQFLPNYNRVRGHDYGVNGNFYFEFKDYEVELMVITEVDTPEGKRINVQLAEKLYDTNTPQEYKLKELLHIPPNEPIPLGFENEPILNRVGRFRIHLPNGIKDAIENKKLGFSLRIKYPDISIHAFSVGTVVIFPTKEHFSGINY